VARGGCEDKKVFLCLGDVCILQVLDVMDVFAHLLPMDVIFFQSFALALTRSYVVISAVYVFY